MSKKFLTCILILAFSTCHSPSFLRADSPASVDIQEDPLTPSQSSGETPYSPPNEPNTPEPAEEIDDETPQGTPVNAADPATKKSSNRQFWTNIIIAGVAVVVAVVSILVVSNNNGKHN